MKIAILGAGNVGSTLGRRLHAAGHEVVYALRNPASSHYDGPEHAHAARLGVNDAVASADAVLLATPWAATEAALSSVADFGGKPLLDATNPIGPGFVLTHGHNDSGAEQVARWAPTARVAKVFNSTGRENMAQPAYGEQRAVMFACSDHDDVRALAVSLANDVGFEGVAYGNLSRARVLEPLAMLWIQLAIQHGDRGFAFGLLRR